MIHVTNLIMNISKELANTKLDLILIFHKKNAPTLVWLLWRRLVSWSKEAFQASYVAYFMLIYRRKGSHCKKQKLYISLKVSTIFNRNVQSKCMREGLFNFLLCPSVLTLLVQINFPLLRCTHFWFSSFVSRSPILYKHSISSRWLWWGLLPSGDELIARVISLTLIKISEA